MRICCLGDLVTDVIVRPRRTIAPGDDVAATIRFTPGGQAANVAAWVAALGGESRLITARAKDAAGTFLSEELSRRGVDVVGPVLEGFTGAVVSLLGEGGERSMLSDRGASAGLKTTDIDPAWLEAGDVLHMSGYQLLRNLDSTVVEHAIEIARTRGARVSFDVSSATEIEQFGAQRFHAIVEALRPDVLFATEREFAAYGATTASAEVVLKRGSRGVTVIAHGTTTDLPAALRTEVVDGTGAGDALAAGYLIGPEPLIGAQQGLNAAARCLSVYGAMP